MAGKGPDMVREGESQLRSPWKKKRQKAREKLLWSPGFFANDEAAGERKRLRKFRVRMKRKEPSSPDTKKQYREKKRYIFMEKGDYFIS